MIIILNLKTEKNSFENIFDNGSTLTENIICSLNATNNYSKDIFKIFSNLFLSEYKEVFIDFDLIDLFVTYNSKFSQVNTEGLDIYPNLVYEKMLENLQSFHFNYDALFTDIHHENIDIKIRSNH